MVLYIVYSPSCAKSTYLRGWSKHISKLALTLWVAEDIQAHVSVHSYAVRDEVACLSIFTLWVAKCWPLSCLGRSPFGKGSDCDEPVRDWSISVRPYSS